MDLGRDEIFTIDGLDEREIEIEIETLLDINIENEELEINLELDNKKRDDLIELQAKLDIRREEYLEFYDSTVKNVIREFVVNQNMEGVVLFESRLKKDKSVKNSLDRKDIKLEDLKDYLGFRFITKTIDDAYTIAGLFMMNHCIPHGMEEELKDENNRFNAYETRDYFKRPKVNKIGEIQYTGIHIFLEKDGKKFEMQIHDIDSYKNANLTHEEYKARKCIERTTQEIDFEDISIIFNM